MALRHALGATRGQVFTLIVSHVGGTTLAGIVVGTLIAWWSGAMMSRYVYGVAPSDPIVLGGSAALVGIAAAAATLLPALRAARVDPSQALRG
jgi:ABC-type antimicrobial peptide transport system permease subunit